MTDAQALARAEARKGLFCLTLEVPPSIAEHMTKIIEASWAADDAALAQVEAETWEQQDGFTITHGEDGWWLNFDGGEGQPKSHISLNALGEGALRGFERPGILAWIKRQQAQQAKEGKG